MQHMQQPGWQLGSTQHQHCLLDPMCVLVSIAYALLQAGMRTGAGQDLRRHAGGSIPQNTCGRSVSASGYQQTERAGRPLPHAPQHPRAGTRQPVSATLQSASALPNTVFICITSAPLSHLHVWLLLRLLLGMHLLAACNLCDRLLVSSICSSCSHSC
jgi:hypothetical protein